MRGALFLCMLLGACGDGGDGLHGSQLPCTPGATTSCACAGAAGVQRCPADGKGFGACECGDMAAPPADLSAIVVDMTMPLDLTPAPDLATPLPPPLAYWNLDEAAGTTAADASGNGYVGTITGGTHVAAHSGNGLGCDGSTSFIDVGNPVGLRLTGAMTLSAWVDIASFATSGRIISKGGGPGQRGWSLNVESATSTASFKIATDTNTNLNVDSAVGTGAWVHVAGVYEPGVALRLYVNGALAASLTTGVPATQLDQALDVNIGRRADVGTYFSGVLDEVRVYDVALTAQQIVGLAK